MNNSEDERKTRPSEAASLAFESGRFIARECLKAEGNSQTWLGIDRQTTLPIVIKILTLDEPSTATRERLAHEARILGEQRTPLLCALLCFGTNENSIYLITEYAPGQTLEARLRQGPLSIAETLQLAETTLATLQHVHGRGILHRDIKPSNIIFAGESGHSQLIDFGLSRSWSLSANLRDVTVGTTRYMSPEQARVLDRALSPASDLYSLGLVLYESLSGQPFCRGATVGEVLREHLNRVPQLAIEATGAVPAALVEFVHHLIEKDPQQRYQSAAAAAADARAIREALAEGMAEPNIVIGMRDQRTALTDPEFVGRDQEFQTLLGEIKKAAQGQGTLVLLEAESGGGKSRLLREISNHARVRVFHGQGVDQGAQRPFQIFAGVAAEVLAYARLEPAFERRLQSSLAEYAEALCDALPALNELFHLKKIRAIGPEALGEARSVRAVAALIDALGSPESPALVCLDDCQWADALSLKLLEHWQDPCPRHTLLIAAYRSEEVAVTHQLRGLQNFTSLTLKPFGRRSLGHLLESMAGKLPNPIIDAIAQLSRGNPFMASAALQGMVECGALVADAQGWQVNGAALQQAQASRKAAVFLSQRLKGFPNVTLNLLSIAAIIGKEFDLTLLAILSGLAPNDAQAHLVEAERRKVVWSKAGQAHYAFVHDKIRETLLELMPTDKKQGLHLEAARALERLDPARIFEIAYHFAAADQHGQALPYAMAAAERARAQYSLDVAEKYFLIAQHGEQRHPDRQLRLRITEGLGDTLMLRGSYEQARAHFQCARALAQDAVEKSRLDGKLGELAFKCGDMEQACEALERAVRGLGRHVPRTQAAYFARLLWELLVQALHTLFPRWFCERGAPEGRETDLSLARLYSRLAYAYWFNKGKIPCGWVHLREMNIVERYPPTPEMAQAYSEHAPVMTMVPWFGRGLEYVQKSYEIRRRFDDAWGQGQSLHFHGVVLYASSRFRECIEKCEQAVRLLERTGDRWEANTASWHIAFSQLRLGNLQQACATSRANYRAAMKIGDHSAAGISLASWAKAARGRVPAALIQAELDRAVGDVHTKTEVLQADGVRLLFAEGRPHEAAARFAKAQALAEGAGLQQEYVASILPWLTTALRVALEQTPIHLHARRRQLFDRAWRAATRAGRIARIYPNNRPHALRERALLESIRGRASRARASFDASIHEAERQGALYELALSRQMRGRIGSELGWPGAATDLDWGTETARRLEAEACQVAPDKETARQFSPSLADRFSTLLEIAHKLSSCLNRESIFQTVEQAAVELLRCQHAHVLAAEAFDGARLSRGLWQRALAKREPVVFSEHSDKDPSASLVFAETRSALCAPIFAHEQCLACFYVVHDRIDGLFGDDEIRLAKFIATLAGAALENAEGFTKIQALSEERRRLHQQAEAAVKVREEFLSIASHELKTPLTSAKLQLHLLMRQLNVEPPPPALAQKMLKGLGNVERQVARLTSLTEDLLDVSRMAHGRLSLARVPLNLNESLEEIIERFRENLRAAGCAVRLALAPELTINGDRARIEQIMLNILANVIKYAPGKPVTIETRREGEHACVRVTDEGPGIPESERERIFQRFERAVELASGVSGLGLGLYICRELMHGHDGTIELAHSSAAGSTFVLKFPLAPARREEAAAPAGRPERATLN